ncbi:MAG: hypothetical protein JWR26_4521 [Pedosphaera sp.]|nr:hypothetical protein [Pedosphaera sp.]
MKFIKAEKDKFSFQIERNEKHLLFQVLKLYPLVPVSHHRLSKDTERKEDQELLEEAVAAQRARHKKQVQAMMRATSRFRENKEGYQFWLKNAQMEWLLQVLNDVRVGSWLAIGSPDGPMEIYAALNEKTAPYFWAMEAAGHFQMVLLTAMSGMGHA